MADFGGWNMPIEYSGVVSEHAAVRSAAGVFDVSHMGKVRVHGAGAQAFLNGVLTNDLDRISDGQAQYSMLCDERGGVVDDLIVYRWSPDELMIIPNASNAAVVVGHLSSLAPEGISVEDHHHDRGIVAVQGPRSAEVLSGLGFPTEHSYMSIASGEFAGAPVAICRSGYTGERGYEIVAPESILGSLWDELLRVGAPYGAIPAGLGARDTLRTEMGYPLHGHELSDEITPVQARLGWAIGWDKPLFVGREALLEERARGPRRVLRAVRAVERAIPRAGMTVTRDGITVGEVTSGTFSPTLKEGIGLALLDPSIEEGALVSIDVRGRSAQFVVARAPFVPARTR